MGVQIITAKALDAFKVKDKQYEVTVGGVKGLKLRVSPGGTKSFYLVDYFHGKRIRLKLGRYPELNLAQARTKARKALVELLEGIHPEMKQHSHKAGIDSFNHLVREFIEKYARVHNKDWRETEKIFKRYFLKPWGARPFKSISKADVVYVLDGLVHQNTPSAANHAFRAVRKLFNWAIERGLMEFSPCLGLKEPAKSVARDRVLSDEELARIWIGADSLDYPFGPIVQLMILTGKRRGEAAGIKWAHLDFKNKVWTLPSPDAKNSEQHILPLMPMALDILSPLPRLSEGLVFPSHRRNSTNPVSGFGKAKARLDILSGVTDWRFHDIRRTVATGLSRLGVLPHVTERVLNHISGSLSPVAKIYNRHHYVKEMQNALELWETHISSILNDLRSEREMEKV